MAANRRATAGAVGATCTNRAEQRDKMCALSRSERDSRACARCRAPRCQHHSRQSSLCWILESCCNFRSRHGGCRKFNNVRNQSRLRIQNYALMSEQVRACVALIRASRVSKSEHVALSSEHLRMPSEHAALVKHSTQILYAIQCSPGFEIVTRFLKRTFRHVCCCRRCGAFCAQCIARN